MNNLIRNVTMAMAIGASTLACAGVACAQNSTQPDNSAQNKSQNQGNTADNQPNGKSDIQITAQIRKDIVADKDLSTYAHNVKIITKNGAVTLKGPVKSDDEKQKVGSIASSAVQGGQVDNQLTVKQ